MEIFLDILKVTIPALIVFLTVYFLFKQYLGQQYQLELLKFRNHASKDILPLKLQAYERLLLLCERISVDHLAFRLMHADMGSAELRNAMLIAIQQEYEHNLTQQIYISDQLWDIIKLVKSQMQEIVSSATGNTPAELLSSIRETLAAGKFEPTEYARTAIRKEVQLMLK
jgi:hypothetical protein